MSPTLDDTLRLPARAFFQACKRAGSGAVLQWGNALVMLGMRRHAARINPAKTLRINCKDHPGFPYHPVKFHLKTDPDFLTLLRHSTTSDRVTFATAELLLALKMVGFVRRPGGRDEVREADLEDIDFLLSRMRKQRKTVPKLIQGLYLPDKTINAFLLSKLVDREDMVGRLTKALGGRFDRKDDGLSGSQASLICIASSL